MTSFETFGQMLSYLRERERLTQRELARAVGYSDAQISRLEKGQRTPDPTVVAARFVEALHLQGEPELAARLIELARLAGSRQTPSDTNDGREPARSGTPTTPRPRQHNLPYPATDLIGRERDVAAVRGLLQRRHTTSRSVTPPRMITLVGPPGVGKTRLALEVARQLHATFDGGVWWVELAPVTDPPTVFTTIAQALAIEDQPGRPILQVLQEHLRAKSLLLVLDNLEQVLDAAPMLSQLLGAAPMVQVLATSRELLRIAGEQGYIVEPLADEAVTLFAQRARALQPDFVIDEGNRDTIAAICRKLDGLPLAIELAASRAPLFTPQRMLAQLDQRLPLLTHGARDVPARQRTLRATLDWSYQLLSPAEQALFRRLGVFAGGCTLHAAQTFCEIDGLPLAAVDGLTALLAKHLLTRRERTGELPRYLMLETTREYALEKLAELREKEAWLENLGWYLVATANVAGEILHPEQSNFREAAAWALSSGKSGLCSALVSQILSFGMRWQEYFEWLEAAIAVSKDAMHPRARAQLLNTYSLLLSMQGNNRRAAELYAESMQLCLEHGLSHELVRVLFQAGQSVREQGDVVLARRYLHEAIGMARDWADANALKILLITWAEVEVVAEDASKALEILDEALDLRATGGSIFMNGWAFNHCAHAALLLARHDEARAFIARSIEIFEQAPSFQLDWGVIWGRQTLGEVALAEGKAEEAAMQLKGAVARFRDFGGVAGVSWCLAALAGAATRAEEPQRAAVLWGAGEALRERIGCRIAPASRRNRERTLELLHAQLGEAEFARLAAEGAKMTVDEAVEYALAVDPYRSAANSRAS